MRSVIGWGSCFSAALAAALATGCGKDCQKENTAPPPPQGGSDEGVSVAVVKYPALEAALAKQKGKVVLVDFWATFCGPCVKKFPNFVELHEKYADKGLACVSVSLDLDGPPEHFSSDKVLAFLREKQARFPNFILASPTRAEEEKMAKGLGYEGGLPHMTLLNRRGEKVWDSASEHFPEKEFAAKVEQLVTTELAK